MAGAARSNRAVVDLAAFPALLNLASVAFLVGAELDALLVTGAKKRTRR